MKTAAIVLVLIVTLIALLSLAAKSHTRRRRDEIWRAIEASFGQQERVDWLYARSGGIGQVVLALSRSAFFITMTDRVARVGWDEVRDIDVDADRVIFGTNIPGSEIITLQLNIPGQGDSSQPLRDRFAKNMVRLFQDSRESAT